MAAVPICKHDRMEHQCLLCGARPTDNDLRAALTLVLRFHSGAPWTEEDSHRWRAVTGTDEATTKVLCDHIRKALG